MSHVEAVACDMNSDYAEAFQERQRHVSIVYDLFHIIKYFNDQVVSEVRKDEQKRLAGIGDKEGLKLIKGSKYILMASRSTLKYKDEQAGSIKRKGSELFKTPDIMRKGGYVERYERLMKDNKLLSTIDIVKDMLSTAFQYDDEDEMTYLVADIIRICIATKNRHFIKFANLLIEHEDGIISHAKHHISTSKLEGINNKIKTIRRHSYGLPDDEYFFLKLFDMSRHRKSS